MRMEVRRFPIRYEVDGENRYMVSAEFIYWPGISEYDLIQVNETICLAKGANKIEHKAFMYALQRYAAAFFGGYLDKYLKELLNAAHGKEVGCRGE